MHTRLDALLRQRELIREHLRWLESEIVGLEGEHTGHLPPPVAPAPAAAHGRASGAVAAADLDAAAPLDFDAEVDVKGLHNEVRRGCLLYAGIATAILGAILAFIYWRY